MSFFTNLSNEMYGWALNGRDQDYAKIFQNSHGGGYGMEHGLFILLSVSVLSAVIFYYGVCSTARNATMKNYFSVGLLGMATLVILTYVVLGSGSGVSGIITDSNMLVFNLINIFYYAVLYLVVSIFIKSGSKASNIPF